MPPPKKKAKLRKTTTTTTTKHSKKHTTRPPLSIANPLHQSQITSIYGYHELTQQNPDWASGIANPLSTAQTFAEALRVTDSVRDAIRGLLPRLPRRGAAIYRPTTLSEATSYVNAREDAKKKQGVTRLDGDVVAVPAESYRAAHPGVAEGDGEAAAFWMYTSDFFRDFCVEDAAELLTLLKSAEELDEFRLAELRREGVAGTGSAELARKEREKGEREPTAGGLLEEPVIQPQRRQRRYVVSFCCLGRLFVFPIATSQNDATNQPTNRDSQKSQRAAGYVFSMPSLSETAEDVALAKALSRSASEHAASAVRFIVFACFRLFSSVFVCFRW